MEINLVGNSIEVKKDPTASPEYIALADVWNIFPLYIPAATPTTFGTGYPAIYPFPSRTTVTLLLNGSMGGEKFMFELQEVQTGVLSAFNGGTKTDLDNAVALINSWL